MRTLTLTLLLAACGTPSPPSAPPAAPEPAASEDASETPAVSEAPAVPERRPLPAAPANPQAVPVALVGYGMRLQLHPPFQAARLDLVEGDNGDGIVLAWWDVTAPGAGQNGVAGLHNTSILPKVATTAGTAPTEAEVEHGKGRATAFRFGQDGTEVRLPPYATTLGGVGELSAGPTDPGWFLEYGEERVPWPADTMVHSADPESGAPVSFLKMPQKPWGPWPETAPAP